MAKGARLRAAAAVRSIWRQTGTVRRITAGPLTRLMAEIPLVARVGFRAPATTTSSRTHGETPNGSPKVVEAEAVAPLRVGAR